VSYITDLTHLLLEVHLSKKRTHADSFNTSSKPSSNSYYHPIVSPARRYRSRSNSRNRHYRNNDHRYQEVHSERNQYQHPNHLPYYDHYRGQQGQDKRGYSHRDRYLYDNFQAQSSPPLHTSRLKYQLREPIHIASNLSSTAINGTQTIDNSKNRVVFINKHYVPNQKDNVS
jgi:hypothetical protein